MWNEAEFLKQHGLDWFAWAGMIAPCARALLLCDTSMNTCIVVSANLLPKAFLTFLCRNGECPGL